MAERKWARDPHLVTEPRVKRSDDGRTESIFDPHRGITLTYEINPRRSFWMILALGEKRPPMMVVVDLSLS